MLASDLQRDLGLTREQAIGLVGNLAMESRGFQTLQEINPTVAGSRGGYGYAQWTGPRRVAFENYARERHLAPDSYAANYGFLVNELTGSHQNVLRLLRGADSVAQAAAIARDRYLIPGIPHVAARADWTQRVADGYAYVPPGGIPDAPADRLAAIQDREAARLGYGEIAPDPGTGRPAYFNETGAPPVPLNRPVDAPRPSTMSPALQAARQRLAAAREMRSSAASNGVTTPEAMAATPRITDTDAEATARRPPLDWGQFRPSKEAGGVGSLLDGGINPAAPNPPPPPVAGLRLPTLPTTITGRPDAPIGSLPAARPSPVVTGRPDAPIGSMPAATPGLSAPGAGLTPQQRAAMSSLRGTIADPPPSIVRTTGGIAGTAELPPGYRPPASVMPSSSPPSSSTTVRPGNTLTAPGAGLTPAQRNAISAVPLSASVRPLTPPSSTPRTTTTTQTITNPAYTEWVRQYGDGSQVQTAATGGMVTRDQLAAIQNVNGAVQAPIRRPAAPPPPPRTITVTRTTQVPAAPAATPPAPRPSPIVSIGGYLYDSSQRTPTGAMLKLGRVGSTSGNTLTMPATKSTGLTGTARVAASLGLDPGSVAAMEAWHGGGGGGGGPAVGGSYGGGENHESPGGPPQWVLYGSMPSTAGSSYGGR